MSASLVDFGLYFYWNAKELLDRGSGPYFYLLKMESHKSAAALSSAPHRCSSLILSAHLAARAVVWMSVSGKLVCGMTSSCTRRIGWAYHKGRLRAVCTHVVHALSLLHSLMCAMPRCLSVVGRRSIRATCLIETLLAAFEMDEILYELRDHTAGLNCGRWDYIFSLIKKLRAHPSFVLPDRSLVTMNTPFMAAYVRLLIRTCNRRGVHAMGGMAAQIPVPNDSAANQAAFERVRLDKEREVKLGHDGTWVAHPALIPVARSVFDQHMPTATQIHRAASDTQPITAAHLLDVPASPRVTLAGVLSNVDVVLSYLSPWLCGVGCVPIAHLMEDAATAEISRCQLWQWRTHRVSLTGDTGGLVDAALITAAIDSVRAAKRASVGDVQWRSTTRACSTKSAAPTDTLAPRVASLKLSHTDE